MIFGKFESDTRQAKILIVRHFNPGVFLANLEKNMADFFSIEKIFVFMSEVPVNTMFDVISGKK